MKNLEWLKEEIKNYIEPYDEEDWLSYEAGTTDVAELILGYIDQVEQPETLSQEWIDDHKVARVSNLRKMTMSDVVPVESLENMLMPKQDEVDRAYKDGYEKGKQHTFYKGYLEGLGDKGSEPETVADVIADFYKSLERFKEVLGTKVEELEE